MTSGSEDETNKAKRNCQRDSSDGKEGDERVRYTCYYEVYFVSSAYTHPVCWGKLELASGDAGLVSPDVQSVIWTGCSWL